MSVCYKLLYVLQINIEWYFKQTFYEQHMFAAHCERVIMIFTDVLVVFTASIFRVMSKSRADKLGVQE